MFCSWYIQYIQFGILSTLKVVISWWVLAQEVEYMIVWIYAVSYPDEFWYHLNGMCAQENRPKKVIPTIFPCTFMLKLNEIVCKYLKTEFLSRGKYPSLSTSNIKYFRTLNPHHRVFLVSLNYLSNDLKKTVCPKNVLMWHWYLLSCMFMLFGHETWTTNRYSPE